MLLIILSHFMLFAYTANITHISTYVVCITSTHSRKNIKHKYKYVRKKKKLEKKLKSSLRDFHTHNKAHKI